MVILMDESTVYKAATRQWGYDSQICKLAENASKVAIAANRILNHCGDERILAETIADMEIICNQLRSNGLGHMIDHFKVIRLDRLAEKLGMGEYD